MFLGFRHGLVFILNHARHEITVGDTIDGHWHRVAIHLGDNSTG